VTFRPTPISVRSIEDLTVVVYPCPACGSGHPQVKLFGVRCGECVRLGRSPETSPPG
jgi:predicted RNA-binding Zn-ribbon protein involved in translation (DUF1610 family)